MHRQYHQIATHVNIYNKKSLIHLTSFRGASRIRDLHRPPDSFIIPTHKFKQHNFTLFNREISETELEILITLNYR